MADDWKKLRELLERAETGEDPLATYELLRDARATILSLLAALETAEAMLGRTNQALAKALQANKTAEARGREEERERCAIFIWPFDEAPSELRALSEHGGDEDWVAVVPKDISERRYIPFAHNESDNWFGCCSISRHSHPNWPDREILIGAHA